MIEQLRDTGMNWRSIAKCLGISEQTLYRHRIEFGVENNFTDITILPQIWQRYGTDYDGPLTDIETDNVVVPESFSLQNRIDPLSDDGNNGINHFLDIVAIMESFIDVDYVVVFKACAMKCSSILFMFPAVVLT